MNKQTRIFKRRLKKRRMKATKKKIFADKRLSVIRKINKIKRAVNKNGTKS